MARIKGGPRGHRIHKKIISMAKGYRGSRNRLFKRANEAVIRAGEHAFSGRKQRKRDLRRLWITRINAGLSKYDIKYSRFISALKKAKIELNRKILSEMAISDTKSFDKVVESIRSFLG